MKTKEDYPKTKEELVKWIQDSQNAGYSIPYCINGGGFSWIQPDDDMSGLADDEDYYDVLEYLDEGEEMEDFKCYMSEDEYEGVTFVRLPHCTGYNQENFDIEIGLYEY